MRHFDQLSPLKKTKARMVARWKLGRNATEEEVEQYAQKCSVALTAGISDASPAPYSRLCWPSPPRPPGQPLADKFDPACVGIPNYEAFKRRFFEQPESGGSEVEKLALLGRMTRPPEARLSGRNEGLQGAAEALNAERLDGYAGRLAEELWGASNGR